MNKPEITRDLAERKLTVSRLFEAPLTRVWNAWTQADQLEKWWGPKDWPATSKSHDFREGGHWHYYMQGPDGTQVWGWVDYVEIEPERFFSAKDFFSDAQGSRDENKPTAAWHVQFTQLALQATKVSAELTFADEASMQRIINMGFEAGFTSALENLDALLSENQK